MKNLIYSVYYTPEQDTWSDEYTKIDYLCWDKKIHIRFDNFTKESLIIGFERKLTYLLTYLMNYSYLPKVLGVYNKEILIDGFLKTSDVMYIIDVIKNMICTPEFKGFKISKNYKKNNHKDFGEIAENCAPVNIVDNVEKAGDLNFFLNKLKVNLIEYLFNDSYVIVLRENKEINYDRKFINKQIKKQNKYNQNNNLVELW